MKIHEALAAIPDWQQRVIAEKIDLDTKRDALRRYKEGSHYESIDPTDRQLLKEQLMAMDEYSAILATRIIRF